MENFSADLFFEMAATLTGTQESIQKGDFGEFDAKNPVEGWIVSHWLPNIEKRCNKIGLVTSAGLVAQLHSYLASGVLRDRVSIANRIESIRSAIQIEMSRTTFMHIPTEQANFYDQKELFGKQVNDKFPGIQFDIVEAGNCYATGRGTACVFHLMRIMETGVQEFGKKLGVTLVNEKNWQNILDEINKAIKALPKSPVTVEMSEAAANLYAVKLAWRNEVMHPKILTRWKRPIISSGR
jgi:hypothetical protein